MPKKIEKHFPADTSMNTDDNGNLILTFLNDKKVDGELYAYLLSLSVGEEKETRIYKSSIPSQTKIATLLTPATSKPLTRQTIASHFKYLIAQGYLIDMGDYYTLPHKEKMYFKVELDTLNFLLDVVKEPVIKTYIYLGQRNNYKPGQYIFTIKELCEHMGIDYSHKSSIITNYLTALVKFNLVEVETIYDGVIPYYKLLKVNTECPKLP